MMDNRKSYGNTFTSTSQEGTMWGYSLSKEDFREQLILKYNSEKMKEFVLVTTKDCSKCRFLKPECEKRCNKN